MICKLKSYAFLKNFFTFRTKFLDDATADRYIYQYLQDNQAELYILIDSIVAI